MKNIFISITAIIISVAIAGCDAADGALVKNTEIAAVPAVTETPAVVVKEKTEFKVGEEATLGDFIIKINKVIPFEPTDEFMQIENDKQLVAVEVEYTNRTKVSKLMSNPLDWSAADNEGYSYGYDLMMAKEPLLNRKIINAGGKVKGWITFQIPRANNLISVQFQPNLLEYENLEFTLR